MDSFDMNEIAVRVEPRVYLNTKDKWWSTIEEAPGYEINEEGQVRYKESGRFMKIRDDGVLDEPYVIMKVNGQNIRRSVYALLRTAEASRRT